MTVAAAHIGADAAVANAMQVASTAIKRGLGERGFFDVQTEEVHVLVVLLLARVGELDEDMSRGTPRVPLGPGARVTRGRESGPAGASCP